MNKNLRPILGGVVATAVLMSTAACDSFLEVENPDVVEASTVDPVNDAETFSLSAQQNFFDAFDNLIVYGAWFTGEAYVGDTFPTRNDIGRRVVEDRNSTLNSEVWAPMQLAIASNERVLELLADGPDAASDLNIARAALNSGYAMLFMAEQFCEGVIRVSGPLTTAQVLDSATVRFNRAITVGTAAGGEGADIANAARVGLARAHLHAGNRTQAAQVAAQVPAGFTFEAAKVDDPSFRGRLGNTVYTFTLARPALVVAPAFRAMNDPRVPWDDAETLAQDGELNFYRQQKYQGYGEPIRLASGLEARYIAAEAEGLTAANLDFVNERREIGGQAPLLLATTSQDEYLAALLDQKARDFFLEGQRFGDFRRNPTATPHVPAAGTPYYKAGQGNIGDVTCFPIPEAEKSNNPNFQS